MWIWRELQRSYAFRLVRTRKFAKAYCLCSKLVKRYPCDAWIHVMLAGLEMDVNADMAKAEYHLAESRRLPGCVLSDWHRMLGYVLEKQQRTEAAIQEYERAVDLDRSVKNLEHLAGALMSYNRARAKPIWEEILTMAPGDAGAYAGLAAIAGEDGDLIAEIECAARAVKIDPGYAYAKEVLEHARCEFLSLREQGRLAEAVAARDIARRIWPHDPEVAAELSRLPKEQ